LGGRRVKIWEREKEEETEEVRAKFGNIVKKFANARNLLLQNAAEYNLSGHSAFKYSLIIIMMMIIIIMVIIPSLH
jgi:hypothetical protein